MKKEPLFIMHEENDSCAVCVVEDLKAGTLCDCWAMEEDTDFQLEAKSDIPIGHKVATRDIRAGEAVIKYGVDIGKCISDVKKGEHLHVHNLKTKRW